MAEMEHVTKTLSKTEKRKNAGLDVFRVVAALMVFAFHSQIHIGCTFGPLTGFVSMGAIFMAGFFMLSGYCLYLGYHQKDLTSIQQVGGFYKKRFIGVMPVYYVVGLLYTVFLGDETLRQIFVLAPIQILGLQSVFSSLFGISHNDGTWFISCLLLCYLIYPFAQEMIKQMSQKGKWLLLLLVGFVVFYGPVIVMQFWVQTIYSNPFFRIMEFLIGILLAAGKEKLEEKKCTRFLFHWCTFVAEFALLILCVGLAVWMDIGVANYMLYNWIAVPFFMLMIVTLSGIPAKHLEKSRLLQYAASISYVFFFAQFFTWPLTRWVMERLGTQWTIIKLTVSFSICTGISVLLHEIVEKRLIKGLLFRTAK